MLRSVSDLLPPAPHSNQTGQRSSARHCWSGFSSSDSLPSLAPHSWAHAGGQVQHEASLSLRKPENANQVGKEIHWHAETALHGASHGVLEDCQPRMAFTCFHPFPLQLDPPAKKLRNHTQGSKHLLSSPPYKLFGTLLAPDPLLAPPAKPPDLLPPPGRKEKPTTSTRRGGSRASPVSASSRTDARQLGPAAGATSPASRRRVDSLTKEPERRSVSASFPTQMQKEHMDPESRLMVSFRNGTNIIVQWPIHMG